MTSPDSMSSLNEKMDILIRIQAAIAIKDMATQRDKIVFLYGAGLKPSFIAVILGTTPGTVTVAMAKYKKSISEKGGISNG